MNKPILAAATGVLFGLFAGGLLAWNARTTCHRSVEVAPQATRVITRTTIVTAPCAQHSGAQTSDDEAPIPTADQDVDSVLSEAQTAFVNGDYRRAIELAQSVDKGGGSGVRSARIQGAAACHLQDMKLLNRVYRRLDAPGRQYLVYVCQRQGITAVGNQFRIGH